MLNIKTYKKSNTKRKENITGMVLFHLLSTQIRILELTLGLSNTTLKLLIYNPKQTNGK